MHRQHRMGQVLQHRVGDNELSHQGRTIANPTSCSSRWREKTPQHRRQKCSHQNWSTSPGMTSRYGHRRVGDRERHNNKQNYWEKPTTFTSRSPTTRVLTIELTLFTTVASGSTSTEENGTSEWKNGKIDIEETTVHHLAHGNQGRTKTTSSSS